MKKWNQIRRMKFTTSICLSLIMLLGVGSVLTACAAKQQNSGAASDEFKVGMECAYAPFNWTQTDDSNGAVALDSGYAGGYDVEIAKKVAEGLGKKLVIVKTEWDGLLPGITSGKLDAIIAGMSPTEERKQSIDFTDNYYMSDLVVVVKKDGPFAGAKSINDLAGAKITAQLNTFHYSVIDQIPGVSQQTAMEDFGTMIVALTSGKIDGYISERPGAKSAAQSNSSLTFVELNPGFTYSPDDAAIAIGLKKDSPLREDINKILAGISEEEREQLMVAAMENQPADE